MNHTLHYIIRFLLGDDVPEEVVDTIGYTNNRNVYGRYRVVIVPSGFFNQETYGTPASLPELPLCEVAGIPLLFGSPKEEWDGETWVVHADIIASTYFLITRYEEMIKRNVRDAHGRFPGKESLPYRAGFLHRPIVDEYRRLLRRWLRQSRLLVPDVEKGIRKVYLTHDVDAPFLYRSWKGVVRSVCNGRGILRSLQGKWGSAQKDPYYTFPWIFRQNSILQDTVGKDKCESILFMRAGGKTRQDKPHYNLQSVDMQRLIKEAQAHGITLGLHSSYQAGKQPERIAKEKKTAEEYTGLRIKTNRHHFLCCREPEDTDRIEAAGCTDDFTMGYADVAGFRLGTCHPVRWINPVTRRLSPLRLHPLIIMDATLDEDKYMGMDYDTAETYCLNLIEQVRGAGGELVLLWHNTSFREEASTYHRKLYVRLLNELSKQ